MPTLVDTNIFLDIVTDDATWADWSFEALAAATLSDTVVINSVIYAELSIGFEKIETLERTLAEIPARLIEIPRAALFLAGRQFLKYRRSGGVRPSVLPDFFIGAHAAVSELRLLTRDRGRYRSYYPTVELIAP